MPKDPAGLGALQADDFPAGLLPHVRLIYTPIGERHPARRLALHAATPSNAFAVQSFLDELAHALGRDPLELRLELLGAPPASTTTGTAGRCSTPAGSRRCCGSRPKGRAGASRSPPAARAASPGHFTFGSYVAQVVEVSRDPGGRVRVDRIVAAVDCGTGGEPERARRRRCRAG